MKLHYLFIIIPFVIALICGISYQIIRQENALDGTLIEVFALVPISWFFVIIGLIASVVIFMKSRLNKHKTIDK